MGRITRCFSRRLSRPRNTWKKNILTIQTRYASLADYERIDAEADNDEEYAKLLESIMGATAHPPVDQFYRVIQSH